MNPPTIRFPKPDPYLIIVYQYIPQMPHHARLTWQTKKIKPPTIREKMNKNNETKKKKTGKNPVSPPPLTFTFPSFPPSLPPTTNILAKKNKSLQSKSRREEGRNHWNTHSNFFLLSLLYDASSLKSQVSSPSSRSNNNNLTKPPPQRLRQHSRQLPRIPHNDIEPKGEII